MSMAWSAWSIRMPARAWTFIAKRQRKWIIRSSLVRLLPFRPFSSKLTDVLAGDRWPTEGPDPADEGEEHDGEEGDEYGEESATSSATLTPTITVTPTPAATSSAVSATDNHSGLAPGAIAGIAMGAAAILLIAAIAIWICGRRSRGRRNTEHDGGSWSLGFLGGKKDPSPPLASTPATMPPAYNPHGIPVMTHASKSYPGASTSIVEHYGSPSGSPPPQMSPNYMQQNFPPHLLDPAAFNYNPYVATTGLTQYPAEQHYQFYRPELGSGTPAPRSPPLTSGMSTAANTATGDRNSVSISGGTHSRGGSPDIVNEMNAISRSPGSINQGGGAAPNMQEPMPRRTGLGMDIKRIDLSG